MATPSTPLTVVDSQPIGATSPSSGGLSVVGSEPLLDDNQNNTQSTIHKNFNDFVGNAWDRLNPMPLLHVINAALGPQKDIEPAAKLAHAIIQSHVDEFNKAIDAYKVGDYATAFRHGLAGATPVVGPSLDQGAEQIARGDVAGGVGTIVGTIAPFALGNDNVKSAIKGVATKAPEATATTATAIKGGAQGLARQLFSTNAKMRNIPVPEWIAGGISGGMAAKYMSAGLIPTEVGAVIGSGIPIVRDVYQGAREALAARRAAMEEPPPTATQISPSSSAAIASTAPTPEDLVGWTRQPTGVWTDAAGNKWNGSGIPPKASELTPVSTPAETPSSSETPPPTSVSTVPDPAEVARVSNDVISALRNLGTSAKDARTSVTNAINRGVPADDFETLFRESIGPGKSTAPSTTPPNAEPTPPPPASVAPLPADTGAGATAPVGSAPQTTGTPGSAKAPTAAATPMQEQNAESPTANGAAKLILAKLNELQPSEGVPVTAMRLRKALPQLTKEQFDKAALQLRQEQKVFLSLHHDPNHLASGEMEELISEPEGTSPSGQKGIYHVSIAKREAAVKPEATAPAPTAYTGRVVTYPGSPELDLAPAKLISEEGVAQHAKNLGIPDDEATVQLTSEGYHIMTPDILNRALHARTAELGIGAHNELSGIAKDRFGVASMKDLTGEQQMELYEDLLNRKPVGPPIPTKGALGQATQQAQANLTPAKPPTPTPDLVSQLQASLAKVRSQQPLTPSPTATAPAAPPNPLGLEVGKWYQRTNGKMGQLAGFKPDGTPIFKSDLK